MADVTIEISVLSQQAERGAKQVESSLRKVEDQTKKTDRSTRGYNATLNDLSKATRLVDGPLGGVASRFQTLNAIVRENNLSIAAFTLGIAAAGFAIREVFKNTIASEKAFVQLRGALEQTKRQTPIEDFQKLAEAIQATTTVEDDAVIAGAALAARFDNLSDNTIKNLIVASTDLSAALGEQFLPTLETLARTINDTGDSYNKLRKIGITFTKDEEALVKALDQTNDVLGLQSFVLAKVTQQYGNAAEVASTTLGGALTRLSNAFGNLFEADNGKTSELAAAINLLADNLDELADAAVRAGEVLLLAFGIGATSRILGFADALVGMNAAARASLPSIVALRAGIDGLGIAATRFLPVAAALGVAYVLTSDEAKEFYEAVSTDLGFANTNLSKHAKQVNGVADAYEKANTNQSALLTYFEDKLDDLIVKFSRLGFIVAGVVSVFDEDLGNDLGTNIASKIAEGAKSGIENGVEAGLQDLPPVEIQGVLDIAQFSINESAAFVKAAIDKEFSSIGDNLRDAIVDGFKDGIERGVDGFADIGKEIKSRLENSLARIVAESFLGGIEQGVLAIGSGKSTIGSVLGIGAPTGGAASSGTSAAGLLSSFGSSGFDLGESINLLNTNITSVFGEGFTTLSGLSSSLSGIQVGGFSSSLGGVAGSLLGLGSGDFLTDTAASTIGGAIGSAILPGIGTFLGSLAGTAIAGAFGSEPNPASTFGGELSSSGDFRNLEVRSKNASDEFANTLSGVLTELTSGLSSLGVDLAGKTLSGGFDVNAPGGGGFFGFGGNPGNDASNFNGVAFDPNDADSINKALAEFSILLLDSAESLDTNVATALENIRDSGKDVNEILSDIEFASTFDELFSGIVEAQPVLSDTEETLKSITAIFEEAADKAKELGLAEEKVIQQRDALIKTLRTDFNQSIQDRLLELTNPSAAELRDLEKEYAEIRRSAIALGADLAAVEQAYAIERNNIVEEALNDQADQIRDTYEDLIKDIQGIRNNLRLDKTLSGTNPLGRASEADRQLAELNDRVSKGDITAIDELNRVEDLLQASIDYYGPTEEYLSRLEQVEALLDSAESLAANTLSTEEKALLESEKQTLLLNDLYDVLSAQVVASQSISDSGLLRPEEEAALLDQANAATGLSQRLTRQLKEQASKGAFQFETTGQTFADFIRSSPNGAQIAEDYNNLVRALGGRVQTFADGSGSGRANGLAIVGEEGPELVNFGRSAQVFSSGQTSDIFSSFSQMSSVVNEIQRGTAQGTNDAKAIVLTLEQLRSAVGQMNDNLERLVAQ